MSQINCLPLLSPPPWVALLRPARPRLHVSFSCAASPGQGISQTLGVGAACMGYEGGHPPLLGELPSTLSPSGEPTYHSRLHSQTTSITLHAMHV